LLLKVVLELAQALVPPSPQSPILNLRYLLPNIPQANSLCPRHNNICNVKLRHPKAQWSLMYTAPTRLLASYSQVLCRKVPLNKEQVVLLLGQHLPEAVMGVVALIPWMTGEDKTEESLS
jgi:hypothetical protein